MSKITEIMMTLVIMVVVVVLVVLVVMMVVVAVMVVDVALLWKRGISCLGVGATDLQFHKTARPRMNESVRALTRARTGASDSFETIHSSRRNCA